MSARPRPAAGGCPLPDPCRDGGQRRPAVRTIESLRLETEALVWLGDGQAALERGAQTVHLARREGGAAAALGQVASALGLAAGGLRGSAPATIREPVQRAVPGGCTCRDARAIERRIREGVFGSG